MYRTVVNLLWTNLNVHKTSLQSSIKVDLHEKSRHKQCAPSALWVITQMAMGLWNPRRLFLVLRQVEKIVVIKLKLPWTKLKLPWWNWNWNCRERSWNCRGKIEIAVVKLKLPWRSWNCRGTFGPPYYSLFLNDLNRQLFLSVCCTQSLKCDTDTLKSLAQKLSKSKVHFQDWEVRSDWTTLIAPRFSRRSLGRKDCTTSQKSVCEGCYCAPGHLK